MWRWVLHQQRFRKKSRYGGFFLLFFHTQHADLLDEHRTLLLPTIAQVQRKEQHQHTFLTAPADERGDLLILSSNRKFRRQKRAQSEHGPKLGPNTRKGGSGIFAASGPVTRPHHEEKASSEEDLHGRSGVVSSAQCDG